MLHPNAEDTKYANQNSKYANQNRKYTNQNSKYAQYWFTLFCRNEICVTNLRTFLAYNLQAKKLRWRTKNEVWEYAHPCVSVLDAQLLTHHMLACQMYRSVAQNYA